VEKVSVKNMASALQNAICCK